jgi:hypothetical protein
MLNGAAFALADQGRAKRADAEDGAAIFSTVFTAQWISKNDGLTPLVS